MKIEVSSEKHLVYIDQIVTEMAESAKNRGTGIAKRRPEYLAEKIVQGCAVVATDNYGNWAGFCYMQSWSDDDFVSNSGLVVSPTFRKRGLAKLIKTKIFNLAQVKFPKAKLFGLTTGLAVMKINSDLGYQPVTYSELPQDEKFWKGCESCINHGILMSKDRKNCLCTAMLFDPKNINKNKELQKEYKDGEECSISI